MFLRAGEERRSRPSSMSLWNFGWAPPFFIVIVHHSSSPHRSRRKTNHYFSIKKKTKSSIPPVHTSQQWCFKIRLMNIRTYMNAFYEKMF